MSTTADRLARAGQHGRATDGHREGVSDTPGGTRPTVVLVDDSQEVRAVVRAAAAVVRLRGRRRRVRTATTRSSSPYRHQPALLLLDTSMPKVDGIEALPAILALSPETKVVMFTGFEEPELAGPGPRARGGRLRREVDPPGGPARRLLGRSVRIVPERPARAGDRPTLRVPVASACAPTPSRPVAPGAGGPERARPAVPRAVRPRGDRHGHPHLERHHRPRQPRAGRADVLRAPTTSSVSTTAG